MLKLTRQVETHWICRSPQVATAANRVTIWKRAMLFAQAAVHIALGTTKAERALGHECIVYGVHTW